MYYKAADLKLVALTDLPIGSIAKFVGRDDIPFIMRLADSDTQRDDDETAKPRIMLLGGEYSFHVTDWTEANEVTLPVCKTSDVRFKLNEPKGEANFRSPGMIVLVEDGAMIASAPDKRTHRQQLIDLVTFDNSDRARNVVNFLAYPKWEIGTLDKDGEFQSIFQRGSE